MAETSDSLNEATALLQPDADSTNTRRESADRWWRRNVPTLPTAFLTAVVLGLNEGYSKNVNTTYIGKDMNEMQKGVFIILLPMVFSAMVPPFVPFLGIQILRKKLMMIAAAVMALGFLGSGFPMRLSSLWPVALGQSLSVSAGGLLNLLTLLEIRKATGDSGKYSIYRAFYMVAMTFGMIAGAKGGAALIEHLEQKSFAKEIRPWQFPFLLECLFAILLLSAISWTASPRQEVESASRPVESGILETISVILCTITPIGLCSILTLWGLKMKYFIIAFILEFIFVFGLYKVVSLKDTPSLYSVAGSKPMLLLVLARATMSATVQTMLYRLPLYSQISMMVGAGPEKQDASPVVKSLRRVCNSTVESADFKQIMLPAYYGGQLLGEFVAATAVWLLGHESIPLGTSLIVYWVLGQLFGKGAIGCFSGATSMQALMSMPIKLTILAGIANGSADNCLSSFLFTAVDNDDRPAAEALSSLASNIVAAAALALAPLRYDSVLKSGLSREYGEEYGLQLAEKALHNIGAVDNFSSVERNVTLQFARNGIEENIWEVGFGLEASVIAASVLYGMFTAGSALPDRDSSVATSA